jgi:hypothetical protein
MTHSTTRPLQHLLKAGESIDDMGGVADGEESLNCHFDYET